MKNTVDEIFGSAVYTYTRAQALADGMQVDVSTVAKEAGFTVPVYVNRSVWDEWIAERTGERGSDEQGRLWDVLFMLRVCVRVRKANGLDGDSLGYCVKLRGRNVQLKALMGARLLTTEDAAPAITILFPNED